MAIGWHDASGAADAGVTTNVTFSYTVSTGADFLLVAAVLGQNSSPTFTGATFNGDAMFLIGHQADALGQHRSALFGLRAPDVATGNVVVSTSGTNDLVWGWARSLSGVEQASDAASYRTFVGGNESGGGSPSLNVTSQSGDMVVDVVGALFGTMVVGADQTDHTNSSPGGSSRHVCSYESATGSSTTMSWTGTSFWAHGAVALVPAGGAPPAAAPTLYVIRGAIRTN